MQANHRLAMPGRASKFNAGSPAAQAGPHGGPLHGTVFGLPPLPPLPPSLVALPPPGRARCSVWMVRQWPRPQCGQPAASICAMRARNAAASSRACGLADGMFSAVRAAAKRGLRRGQLGEIRRTRPIRARQAADSQLDSSDLAALCGWQRQGRWKPARCVVSEVSGSRIQGLDSAAAAHARGQSRRGLSPGAASRCRLAGAGQALAGASPRAVGAGAGQARGA